MKASQKIFECQYRGRDPEIDERLQEPIDDGVSFPGGPLNRSVESANQGQHATFDAADLVIADPRRCDRSRQRRLEWMRSQ